MHARFAVQAIALLLLLHSASAFYILLKEGTEKCFLEDVPTETMVMGVYKNPDVDPTVRSNYGHPAATINVKVKDPSQVQVMSQTLNADGRFAFTSHVQGEHQICFATEGTNYANREFRLWVEIQVGEHATDYEEIAKMEHLSAIEVEIRKLNDKVKAIRSDQQYMKEREEKFRDTSESTNARVMWWSIAQSIFLLGVGYYQFTKLKKFFVQRKLA